MGLQNTGLVAPGDCVSFGGAGQGRWPRRPRNRGRGDGHTVGRRRWVCGLVAFHQNMNQCGDLSTFFFFFPLHVFIETDNKEERMWKVRLKCDFVQCLWPGYKSSTTALE